MHREWMIRAFAVGLAVATIRPIIGMFFATSQFSGLTPYQFFGTAFWIGFVLHLMAAEIWIHRTMPRTELESLQNQSNMCSALPCSLLEFGLRLVVQRGKSRSEEAQTLECSHEFRRNGMLLLC